MIDRGGIRSHNGGVGMMLRAMRWVGWMILAAATVAPLAMLFFDLRGGPPAWSELRVGGRLAGILLRTVVIAAAAGVLATGLSLPALYAAAHARGERVRVLLFGMAAAPLLSPACVFGYSWMLAASQRGRLGRLLSLVGFNDDNAGPARAAVALATWLWPIPAMLLATSYLHGGRAAYRMARLDAGAVSAFVRGALPAMAGAAAAAFAIVFVLSMNESTIAPLVLTRTWPAEMAPEVLDSAMYGSPAAALAWKSWPVVGLVGVAALVAWPGLRRVWDSVEQETALDLGGAALSGGGGTALAVAVTALIALAPICIFVSELYSARISLGEAIHRVWTLYGAERRASLIVAGLAGMAGMAIAWSTCDLRLGRERSIGRVFRAVLLGSALLSALLPAELMAQLLVQLFNRRGIAGRLYDDTPVVWVLGIVARYGFFAAAMGWYAARRVPVEVLRQARIDGVNDAGAGFAVARPWVIWPIVAAAILMACLSLSEVAASLVLIPPRFGGSLAVALDNQMHYGRNLDVIVTTLMLLVPLAVFAMGLAIGWGGAEARRRKGAAGVVAAGNERGPLGSGG